MRTPSQRGVVFFTRVVTTPLSNALARVDTALREGPGEGLAMRDHPVATQHPSHATLVATLRLNNRMPGSRNLRKCQIALKLAPALAFALIHRLRIGAN